MPQLRQAGGSREILQQLRRVHGSESLPNCGAQNAQGVRFCNNCGTNLAAAAAPPSGKCPACGTQNTPGVKFCGGCGNKLM